MVNIYTPCQPMLLNVLKINRHVDALTSAGREELFQVILTMLRSCLMKF